MNKLELDVDQIEKSLQSHTFKLNCNGKTSTITHLSKQQCTFIWEAIYSASKSEMMHKHGAVLVQSNRIISRGHNIDYGNMMYHGHWSKHAEVNVIEDAKLQKELGKNIDIYVVRLKIFKNTIIGVINSQPCCNCQRMASDSSIHRIFYS